MKRATMMMKIAMTKVSKRRKTVTSSLLSLSKEGFRKVMRRMKLKKRKMRS